MVQGTEECDQVFPHDRKLIVFSRSSTWSVAAIEACLPCSTHHHINCFRTASCTNGASEGHHSIDDLLEPSCTIRVLIKLLELCTKGFNFIIDIFGDGNKTRGFEMMRVLLFSP